MLSNHSQIRAGDEQPTMNNLAAMARAWLQADEDYPFALMELAIGDKGPVLQAMRAYYIARGRALYDPDKAWLTDKMPLNEMHLPFIGMMFDQAPIFYVRRHPLDVVVSNFSNYLTHGFNQSFDLVSCATHYARVDDLVAHYVGKLAINLAQIRYEELVTEPRREITAALEVVGAPFEDRCLAPELNRNHPRTPSYDAVKQPINGAAVDRWRKFEPWLKDVIPIVQPIMNKQGY
jgi:hypothetical protein